MVQLNQITQQNATASEELSSTAEEMNGQAEQLQQLMEFFTVAGKVSKGKRGDATAPTSQANNKQANSKAQLVVEKQGKKGKKFDFVSF